MNILWCDTETYSETPIKDGTYKYTANAEVMLFAYAWNNEPVKVWDRTLNMNPPESLEMAYENVDRIVFHNSNFDRNVIKHSLDWEIPTARIFDTMACAYAHGLPGGLGVLCDIFNVNPEDSKDKAGRNLIHLFCKPQAANRKVRRATRETHPEQWRQFIAYAAKDIDAMRAIYKKLPKWNYKGKEFDLWILDQKINDRGFKVDIELAQKALETINKTQKRLSAKTAEMTDGEIASTTQRDALLRYILAEHGIKLPDMQAATLERRIDDPELPDAIKQLLTIRAQATTSSTSKYKKLLGAVSADGRLRGTLQFCGAHRTGRWSGRTFQPQNLPRPMFKKHFIEEGIEALKVDCLEYLVGDGNVMKMISSAIRGCIVAPKGKKIVISDLANIEGRVAAWLAGEDWKLQAFTDYDNGTGADLYTLAYARAFDIDATSIDKDTLEGYFQRQIGKVMELFLQYEGGVGAFITGADTYKIDLTELAEKAYGIISKEILAEAESMWNWAVEQKRTLGLDKKVFVVCDSLKRMWRGEHPEISSYWKQLSRDVETAIMKPGTSVTSRKLVIKSEGGWLTITLPSGRKLCYPSPRYEEGKLTYAGINQYTRQWGRIGTYGGKLFENICQAVARDVMAENMPHIENAGYEIILSVHDELLTETPDTEDFTEEYLTELLATNPIWAKGLPLAAGGFETYRYRKD